eukprot:7296597-Prymnesium_polylepis.1
MLGPDRHTHRSPETGHRNRHTRVQRGPGDAVSTADSGVASPHVRSLVSQARLEGPEDAAVFVPVRQARPTADTAPWDTVDNDRLHEYLPAGTHL